jgi:hypothetical protein
MYEQIERFAEGKHFKKLTLNTYQEKFPVMYAFAMKHGFDRYKTEVQDGIEKSYFEKELNAPPLAS